MDLFYLVFILLDPYCIIRIGKNRDHFITEIPKNRDILNSWNRIWFSLVTQGHFHIVMPVGTLKESPLVSDFVTILRLPSRQNCRKSKAEECIFYYMASHIECQFNKSSLLQCYFLAILPAGFEQYEWMNLNTEYVLDCFNYNISNSYKTNSKKGYAEECIID